VFGGSRRVGDAVGTTVAFESRGSFPPITDTVGRGPFGSKAGQWTGDTPVANDWQSSRTGRRSHITVLGSLAGGIPGGRG